MTKTEIFEYLSGARDGELFPEARRAQTAATGDNVFVRGIIEFSNNCARNCAYCGLRRDNRNLSRYDMPAEDIVNAVRSIYEDGIRTVVLQSGDNLNYTREMVCGIIENIKKRYKNIAITLSLGERPLDDYKAFKDSGSDRYLLRIETTNSRLYKKLHPGQSLKKRINILENLRKMKYQVGTGIIVGLPGQSMKDLAEDILFFKKFQPDMIGLGPFVSQKDALLKNVPNGAFYLTLRVLALARIVTKNAYLPITTALVTIAPEEKQSFALNSGADVIMPDYTPKEYSKNYKIYDNKSVITLPKAKNLTKTAKRVLSFQRADSLKIT
ncbi:MAG: [FeFe] hydrogenase H-cluster radical SAM maturase HydE [Candidatus Omnitrophica bacterium]|nr:[FeFe] hydrogenase H-cluster radical SAM maturase HydE [Candidatus Omnitrophota bacterium]